MVLIIAAASSQRAITFSFIGFMAEGGIELALMSRHLTLVIALAIDGLAFEKDAPELDEDHHEQDHIEPVDQPVEQ
jgi:hypothetical protein